MFKQVVVKTVCLLTLFFFYIYDIKAYEYVDPNNEQLVTDKITQIYDTKEQYMDLIGGYDEIVEIQVSNKVYWWPIGSLETTEKNGKIYASGNPISTTITSKFGNRPDPKGSGNEVFHSGLDIGSNGQALGQVNIIASRSGEVIYPVDNTQTNYEDNATSTDGGGYGNYIILKHSDGTYTLYGHLSKNSITVFAGDVVDQGQVIAKMGNSGNSTGLHLHFEIRLGDQSVDPIDYLDFNNLRPSTGGGEDFSLTSTILSKEEFESKMNSYCTRSNKKGFCNTFAKNSGSIYEASLKNNINPELVVVTAGAEQDWTLSSACKYTNNYWGIGIGNGQGCNKGGKYNSLEEGIAGYANVISNYNLGGKYSDSITKRYNERESANCDSSGHGMPGTFAGMQSVYSWVGDYRYDPGSWGKGGCSYLNIIYGQDYCKTKPTCKNYSNCSKESKTTTCEQNDYTAWQIKKKNQIRYDIFGL